jgi:serine/threonine protein kinase
MQNNQPIHSLNEETRKDLHELASAVRTQPWINKLMGFSVGLSLVVANYLLRLLYGTGERTSEGARAVGELKAAYREGLKQCCDSNQQREAWRQFIPFLFVPYVFGVKGFVIMIAHRIYLLSGLRKKFERKRSADLFVFTQNKETELPLEEVNFYQSAIFPVTLLAIFLLGLPAMVTLAFYHYFGIDAFLGYPSRNPQFFSVIVLIQFYLMGLCWCLCPLALRAFFMFPLHFWNPECEVEISSSGIKKLSIKGWYSELLLFFNSAFFPANLHWQDIVHVNYAANGFGRLTPLPDMGWNYPRLDPYLKMQAAITDALVDKHKRCEYVIFQTGEDLEREKKMIISGRGLKIRLGDLSTKERARLAESIYKWAPHASFNPEAQKQLLGSSNLCGPESSSILLGLLTSAIKTDAPIDLEIGSRLQDGKYTITKKVSLQDGTLQYLAKTETGEDVIIKVFIVPVKASIASQLSALKDFEREHRAHLLINENRNGGDDGIIRMREVFYQNGAVFLVLARPKGCTLGEFVRERGSISETKAIGLLKQMCDMLSCLHSRPTPIILRSLSPDSLVIDGDDTLVLTDLSLAGKTGALEQCSAKGRRGYASLEQLSGNATITSDIYSLGATLYFMLTGKDPDPIHGCQIDFSSETSGKISPAMANIITKATHKDPKLSYTSAEGLKYDLVLSKL